MDYTDYLDTMASITLYQHLQQILKYNFIIDCLNYIIFNNFISKENYKNDIEMIELWIKKINNELEKLSSINTYENSKNVSLQSTTKY